jgi:hypothetical protein
MGGIGLSLCLVLGAFAFLALRVWSDRSERGRALARQFYAWSGLLFPMRTFLASVPLSAAGLIVLGLGLLGPRPVALAATWVGIALTYASFLMGYRSPHPFMASWMRAEIALGSLPGARPDWLDWLYFLMLGAMGLGGLIAIPFLVLTA